MAVTVCPFALKTTLKPRAGFEQDVPARQTGIDGLMRTVPYSPPSLAPPELCAPQAATVATAAAAMRVRTITSPLG